MYSSLCLVPFQLGCKAEKVTIFDLVGLTGALDSPY